jgi:hypothetical protein
MMDVPDEVDGLVAPRVAAKFGYRARHDGIRPLEVPCGLDHRPHRVRFRHSIAIQEHQEIAPSPPEYLEERGRFSQSDRLYYDLDGDPGGAGSFDRRVGAAAGHHPQPFPGDSRRKLLPVQGP